MVKCEKMLPTMDLIETMDWYHRCVKVGSFLNGPKMRKITDEQYYALIKHAVLEEDE